MAWKDEFMELPWASQKAALEWSKQRIKRKRNEVWFWNVLCTWNAAALISYVIWSNGSALDYWLSTATTLLTFFIGRHEQRRLTAMRAVHDQCVDIIRSYDR